MFETKNNGYGVSAGAYDITIGERKDGGINEYTWTIVESQEIVSVENNTVPTTAKPQVLSPITSDTINTVLLGTVIKLPLYAT